MSRREDLERQDLADLEAMRAEELEELEPGDAAAMLGACKLFIQAAGGYDGALTLLIQCAGMEAREDWSSGYTTPRFAYAAMREMQGIQRKLRRTSTYAGTPEAEELIELMAVR